MQIVSFIGAGTTFITTFDRIVLCFQLGVTLFASHFPFRAERFKSKGYYKHLHIVTVVCGLFSGACFVGLQFALGGYSRTVVPIFCLAGAGSAFVFSVIPLCVLSAIFLSIVMILLFKIVGFGKLSFSTKVRVYVYEILNITSTVFLTCRKLKSRTMATNMLK